MTSLHQCNHIFILVTFVPILNRQQVIDMSEAKHQHLLVLYAIGSSICVNTNLSFGTHPWFSLMTKLYFFPVLTRE